MWMFHKHVCLSIAALFIAFSASAQDGGKDANNLNAKIDAIFAQYDKPDSPGCALGVIKDGKLVYARGYGMANMEHGVPNGPKLVYDIGSTSKQFTAASILLLAQQGKLSLDDDARKHIPELPAYQKPITIRNLLHHTSGVRDYLTLFSLAGVNFDDTTTEKDALDIIVRQKALNFTPGDEWLYSNSGYFPLSIIIKRASGKSFAEFAKENIFDQLGMKHTLILDNHKRLVPMRATGYSPNPQGGFQIEMSNFEQTGDGAVQTSIEDLWIDDLTMLTSSLKPLSETRFIAGPDGSWVEFNSAGAKTQLHLSRNNRKPETFERVEAFEPSAGQLNEFAGSYYSFNYSRARYFAARRGKIAAPRSGLSLCSFLKLR